MNETKGNSHSFQGTLDRYDHPGVFMGWARLVSSDPHCRVEVALFINDEEVARTTARNRRTDLESLGDGHYGFELHYAGDIGPGLIASGHVRLKPVFENIVGPPLNINPRIVSEDRIASAMSIVATSAATDQDLYKSALERLDGMIDHEVYRSLFDLTGDADSQKNTAQPKAARTRGDISDLSTVLVQSGLMSRDSSAILGKDGHVFLVGGNNDFLRQWELESKPEELEQLTEKWVGLIKQRQELCANQGIDFVQVLILEKLSTLKGYFPKQPETVSPLLGSISEIIPRDASLDARCVLHPWKRSEVDRAEAMFRKTDSHLTPYGTFELFREIMKKLGIQISEEVDFSEMITIPGDLSDRFFDVPLLEQLPLAPEEALTFLGGSAEVVDQFVPESGGHVGRWQHCFNKTAPSDKTILVFGNSFSSFIEGGQPALSWWLSRCFRHYHFYWQGTVDWELVGQIRPDIVIHQTNERFMRIVPPA
jgi:hypothetical protein